MADSLSRTLGIARAAAPVRIVHLGLGNFFRAHEAWYTEMSRDADDWGIAAFTGRRAAAAERLRPQDGLYTMITRADDGDRFDVIASVSAVHSATDDDAWAAWLDYMRRPELAIITLTVTEAGYRRGADGGLDQQDDDVRADVEALRADRAAPVVTVPARLLSGLIAREGNGLGPLAIVPCDNLPDNASVTADVVHALAALVDPVLTETVDRTARFVTTMVDRITPKTTDDDLSATRIATGMDDAAPVVTEPFSEWVLGGEFPAGRPAWQDAGAVILDDPAGVAVYEQRKLWLLNGGHSLLAYAASTRGHETVAEAVADDTCRAWLEQWWDEASSHLALPDDDIATYRNALMRRFANPRMRHKLTQIATDGSQKLPVRVGPVIRAERHDGRVPSGACRTVAAWIAHLRGHGAPIVDVDGERCVAAAAGPVVDAVSRVLALLGPGLADDRAVVDAVVEHVEDLVGAG